MIMLLNEYVSWVENIPGLLFTDLQWSLPETILLLGFFIAWLTLTGTAQQIVGIATVASTILWLVTIPLREEKEE